MGSGMEKLIGGRGRVGRAMEWGWCWDFKGACEQFRLSDEEIFVWK